MKIGLIGYGKMGKAIEQIALSNNHEIVARVESPSQLEDLKNADVAIEFSQPEVAVANIKYCLTNQTPVVSGTTGWLDSFQEVVDFCKELDGTFLYASNFSIGVNLFFELNKWLAQRVNQLGFNPSMEEIHHTEKKDSPSGTAITLAEGILENYSNIADWINEESTDQTKIGIVSKRIPNVPGTHSVSYTSSLETISIQHEAHDRSVFAQGALQVALWIKDKKGVLSMSDFLGQE